MPSCVGNTDRPTYKDVGNAERCMEQRRPLRAMTGKGVTFPARMPRPCTLVALDEIRFMLRGHPAMTQVAGFPRAIDLQTCIDHQRF